MKFQLWEIFYRKWENIDERTGNIMWTVYALFVMVPAMILCIVGSFHGLVWLTGIGVLLWVWAICRFVVGLKYWG